MEKLSIKTHRLLNEYSVHEVAEEVGVSESTIRNIERDPKFLNGAKYETIRKMCDMYGITTENIKT